MTIVLIVVGLIALFLLLAFIGGLGLAIDLFFSLLGAIFGGSSGSSSGGGSGFGGGDSGGGGASSDF